MARILIIAKGSYGDLFPMYALAERLLADGHRVVFATQRCHQKAAALTGATVALFESPDQEIRQRSITIWTFLSPERLKDEVDRLMVVARGMDLIIGNQLALFGSVVAERLGTPWMYCPVSPLAFPSRFRSALLPYLHWLQRLTGRSPRLQPAYLWLSRTLGGWTLESVARQRRTLLPGDCLHPMFEGMYSSVGNLLLSSPLLLQPQPDWPTPSRVAGFTWYQPDFLVTKQKAEALERFLSAGASPVVFAMGGTSRLRPRRFFLEGLRAARSLGLRSIVVVAQRFHSQFAEDPDLLVTGYMPYSQIFPHVRAVVHSGGIGTIAWSLRCATPSLLIPSSLDQFDNADLVSQLGYAHVAFQRQHRRAWLTERLAALLEDTTQRSRLKMVAPVVASEDGAAAASRWIAGHL